jgi:hypothetical protein
MDEDLLLDTLRVGIAKNLNLVSGNRKKEPRSRVPLRSHIIWVRLNFAKSRHVNRIFLIRLPKLLIYFFLPVDFCFVLERLLHLRQGS